MTTQEFGLFLKNSEELVKKAKLVNWIENSFKKIHHHEGVHFEGAYCRTLLAFTVKQDLTIESASEIIGIKYNTTSQYLKDLNRLGILDTKTEKGKIVYTPRHEDEGFYHV